jgi:hypothetical protein
MRISWDAAGNVGEPGCVITPVLRWSCTKCDPQVPLNPSAAAQLSGAFFQTRQVAARSAESERKPEPSAD